MKKKILIFGVAVAGFITMLAAVGCTNKSNTANAPSVNDTLTLNLYDTSYVNWTDTVAGSYPTCQGGYWNDTYTDAVTSLRFGSFIFSHTAVESWNFWGAFTTGSNGNNFNYIADCQAPPCWADTTHAASQGWICNQWGVMAGGAITNTANPQAVTKPAPYLIGYWDYYDENSNINLNSQSTNVRLAGDTLFKPIEIYICNHPWPYYGNIQGDGFARPLNQPNDKFDLIIHAVHANNTESTYTYHLAQYTGKLNQSATWKSVPLTALGDSIKYLYFTMTSTDSDPTYGPNTAVYFDMDKLKVVKQGVASTSTAPAVAKTESPKASGIEVKDYFPKASYSGGEVTVFDANGKEVWKTTVKAGEKINLTKLPAGEYRLRHGHKIIPITKK